MNEERIIMIPFIGECIFQVNTDTEEPTGMYRNKDEVEENSQELQWLNNKDEKDLCDKNNYEEGVNGLYLHAKHLDFVKRIWAYCDFNGLI